MPENNEGEPQPTDTPKTFTQDQVNALLATEKRKFGEKYADYDALKEKATKFDDLEQSSKTELQKALDKAAGLESELTTFKQKEQTAVWAAEIVKDSDIPASVLRGSTREELEQHFEQLKALTPKPKRTPVPTGKPAGEGGESRAVAALRQLGLGSN